jgi:dolichol-phosphate mannosyltransferase
MINNNKIAVVIPCFRVSKKIFEVIAGIPTFVDLVILVDDRCPENSGRIVEAKYKGDPRLFFCFREENGGVGAATITGYRVGLDEGADILVKMDGDGQMDPKHLTSLIAPIEQGRCDYSKGNRFTSQKILQQMPTIRLIGNSALSFMVKVASGYWNVMDPTNGYTAISSRALQNLNLSKVSERYFFEIDLLCSLNLSGAVVRDVSMDAKYDDEPTSLSVLRAIWEFPPKLAKRFIRRVFLQYFIYDFNMATVYLVLGLPVFIGGVLWGATSWYTSFKTGQVRPLGEIMLAVLPIMMSFNLLLHAIQIDIAKSSRVNNEH